MCENSKCFTFQSHHSKFIVSSISGLFLVEMKKEGQMLLFQTFREIKFYFQHFIQICFYFFGENWGARPPPPGPSPCYDTGIKQLSGIWDFAICPGGKSFRDLRETGRSELFWLLIGARKLLFFFLPNHNTRYRFVFSYTNDTCRSVTHYICLDLDRLQRVYSRRKVPITAQNVGEIIHHFHLARDTLDLSQVSHWCRYIFGISLSWMKWNFFPYLHHLL